MRSRNSLILQIAITRKTTIVKAYLGTLQISKWNFLQTFNTFNVKKLHLRCVTTLNPPLIGSEIWKDLYVGTIVHLFFGQITQKIPLKITCIAYRRCAFDNKIISTKQIMCVCRKYGNLINTMRIFHELTLCIYMLTTNSLVLDAINSSVYFTFH